MNTAKNKSYTVNFDKAQCPLCGDAGFYPWRSKECLTIGRCLACGFYYTHPFPSEGDLKSLYGEAYYSVYINDEQKKRAVFRERIQWLKKFTILEGKLLDVGCETGIFLEMIRQEGLDITGIEISETACRYAYRRLGPVIFQGDIRKKNFADNTFDIVTLWHTLEHVPDPLGYLMDIRRILKPGGRVIVEVPNIQFIGTSFLTALGRTGHFLAGEHLVHFSPKTIKMMIEKAGFTITKPESGKAVVTDFHCKALIEALFMYMGRMIYLASGINMTHCIRISACKE